MRSTSGFGKSKAVGSNYGSQPEPQPWVSYAAILGAEPTVDLDRPNDASILGKTPVESTWAVPIQAPEVAIDPEVAAKNEAEAAWDAYIVARLGSWVANAAHSEAYAAFRLRERAPLAAIADSAYSVALNGLVAARTALEQAERRHSEAVQATLQPELQQAPELAAPNPAQ